MNTFISHAVVDADLVKHLVDLLKLGAGVSDADIFFSSSQGKIPNGAFFVQRILTKLNDSQLVISVISKAYLNSRFCLEELGASQVRNLAATGDFYSVIVPPVEYFDLDAVLYGVQSGSILDEKTLDELRDRVAKGVSNPPSTAEWNQRRKDFLAKARELVGLGVAQSQLKRIKLMDITFDREDKPSITYKLKLRVVFRNETGRDIEVLKPTWFAKPGQVHCRPNQWSSVQLEGPSGWLNDSWKGEADQQHVRNGESFRIWIGLDPAVTDQDYRRKHASFQVGTLITPVKIDGFDLNLSNRV